MRLKQYINEGNVVGEDLPNFTELQKRIEKDCKKYLGLLKGKDPLVRGMYLGMLTSQEYFETTLLSDTVRQDRKPQGTQSQIFKELNKMLEKEGHVRRDKAKLLTSNVKHARTFSENIYFIFPIGNFHYTWLEGIDFNLNDKSTGWRGFIWPSIWYNGDEESRSRMQDNMKKRGKNKFEDWFTTDKGFDIAYKKGYEIWMDPKKYYILDIDIYRKFWK